MSEENKNDANSLEHLIDHADISTEQKKVAEDILQLVKNNQSKNIPLKFTISQIENDYKIKEIPLMSTENSLWYQFTKDEKIGANIQGYRTIEKNGQKLRIPYIAFGADLEYLDEMMKRIITQVNMMKKDG